MSAAEKKQLDAILDTLGSPPDWFDVDVDDDGIVDAKSELQSFDRVIMHRPMSGNSES